MHSLVLSAPEALVEQASDALMFELDALSVTVEDADADSHAEQALFGEPGMPAPAPGWLHSRVVALFPTVSDAQAAADALLSQPWATDIAFQAITPVPDADWVRLTQSQFDPIAITDTFWVVPSWHEAPAKAERVMRLDPGMAFGSGTHPTTRMCLRWIATHLTPNAPGATLRVLDYGCGSGILALGAAMHGAHPVVAVDIDPAAVTATQDNARANGVVVQAGLPEAAQGHFDVVLANILATPLKVLAPLLCGHLGAGGRLVMAGVLTRQLEELQAAYAPWCKLSVADEQEGWILLTATLAKPL
jgi:ribosomal protein L11 methyltransferase